MKNIYTLENELTEKYYKLSVNDSIRFTNRAKELYKNDKTSYIVGFNIFGWHMHDAFASSGGSLWTAFTYEQMEKMNNWLNFYLL